MKKNILMSLVALSVSIFTIQAQDCDGMYAFKEGKTVTLKNTDAKGKVTSTIKQKFAKVSANGGEVVADLESTVFDAKDKQLTKSNLSVKCKDGIVYWDTRGMLANEAALQNANVEVKVSGDALDIPKSFTVGQTLKDVRYTVQATMNGLKIMNKDFVIKNRKVEAQEKITTPAGTFDAYKVSYEMETKGLLGKANVTKTMVWYSKGVGVVKTEEYDSKGKLQNTTTLVNVE